MIPIISPSDAQIFSPLEKHTWLVGKSNKIHGARGIIYGLVY
jgi:hypothetical protein